MNRIEAIELSQALSSKELRAKHLSGNDLVNLAYLKKEMTGYFETMHDAEQAAGEADGISKDENGQFLIGKNREFEKKLLEIQKAEFNSKHLNLIPTETIEKFVKETDVSTAIVIIQHLGAKPE